ncbi:MAG: zinc ribbon domain-containing protein, partial [bacterium]
MEDKHNCLYAGKIWKSKRHSLLCVKYFRFIDKISQYKTFQKWSREIKKEFPEHAEHYLQKRKDNSTYSIDQYCLDLKREHNKIRSWVPEVWNSYKKEMGLEEEYLLNHAQLPHCKKPSDDCTHNPHTDKCVKYRKLIIEKGMTKEEWELDRENDGYREWRKSFLTPPKRPVISYPSARKGGSLIFGKGFFKVDWEQSMVGLRLFDYRSRYEFIWLGFKPWPKNYRFPIPSTDNLTSVCINVVGTRLKVGFAFRISLNPSRFTFTQDELDRIREKQYPPKPDEYRFPAEVREFILKGFTGQPEQLKLVAVDVGDKKACAVLYEGTEFQKSAHLKILKLDKTLNALDIDEKAQDAISKKRGLTLEHLSKHIEQYRKKQKEIAQHRSEKSPSRTPPLRSGDLRELSLHMRWMVEDWARHHASQIVRQAKQWQADLIVLESLRGFSPPGYDQLNEKKKRRLAFFAFGKVRTRVKQQAEELGMRVVTAPYKMSSQVCSSCGKKINNKSQWEKNKSRGFFHCEYCQNKFNSE